MEKVGFLLRLVAYLIDAVILAAIYLVLGVVGVGQTTATVILVVVAIVYVIGMWTLAGGQTVGKMLVGIKVVSTDGSPITIGKAVLRYIGYIVSSLIVCLGFLWVIWDADKQGWHDKIAGTYVVKVTK